MQIQTHTDNHIQGDELLHAHVQDAIEHALGRYEDRITRVEVFLAEEHSRDKHVGHLDDEDKRCVIEVRMRGLKPISVRHYDTSVRESLDAAATKMMHLVEKTIGRLSHRHDSISPDDLPQGAGLLGS